MPQSHTAGGSTAALDRTRCGKAPGVNRGEGLEGAGRKGVRHRAGFVSLSWSSPVLGSCVLWSLQAVLWEVAGSRGPDGHACPPTTCVDVPPSWPQSPDLGFGGSGSPLSSSSQGKGNTFLISPSSSPNPWAWGWWTSPHQPSIVLHHPAPPGIS